ncbi:MAG: aldehyde dehydrogenase [Vulcanimicrobiaceae bacterium]
MLTATRDNFIEGAFVREGGRDRIDVLNPSRNTVISDVPDSGADVVDRAVASAKKAQKPWAKLPAIVRAGYLRQISAKIRENADEIAAAIVEEQGKLAGLAAVEAVFAADYFDYMAEWARRIEGEIISSDRPGENVFLFRKPIGVVAGILPWNFPFFLIARKAAPALITGNTIVIKPSEETPMNALIFARLMAETDLPPGVINIVFGRGSTTGKALSSHPDVGLVSFTGSVATGSAIMHEAANNITKVNLELGGKAPAIVLADADLELAVKAISASRLLNSGQVCNAAERVYVDAKVADEFTQRLASVMSSTKVGDPAANATQMGPLINRPGLQRIHEVVKSAVADGAQIVTGGKPIELDNGNFFQPTVLTNVNEGMGVMRDEVFGPVLPVATVGSLEEAIERANDSMYGLTSSIYTTNLNLAMRAINELEFGETYINRENFEAMQGYHAGTRRSGIGGADGKHGLYEYTRTHIAYIQT